MIYCIGDANWDLLVHETKPVLEKQKITRFEWVPGGEAQNTARWLWRLGNNTKLVSRVGDDFLGRALGSISPFASFSFDESTGTGLTIAFISRGKRGFITDKGANRNLSWKQVNTRDIKNSEFIFKGGYWHNDLFREGESDYKLFRTASKFGIPSGLNLGWNYLGWTKQRRERLFRVLESVDFLFVNRDEAIDISGKPSLDKALKFLAGFTTVILHSGKHGCEIARESRKFERIRIKTNPLKVENPVGTGDAFNAGFIHEFMASGNIKRSCKSGNRVAALHLTGRWKKSRSFKNKQ